jgi:hypothetical protein
MNSFDWQKKNWRERIMLGLTVVLVIALASHPELRLFLSLLDALGLDLLLLLISVQFLDYARPLVLITHRRIILPLSSKLYGIVLFFFGMMGPYVDARVATHLQWRNTTT